MKHLLYISSAALILSACSAASEPSSSTQAAAPAAATQVMDKAMDKMASHSDMTATQVKAVRIYADWCGKCKILDAQLKTLRAANEYPNIEFIYLDYTAKDPAIFYAQAKELGIEAQVKAALGERIGTGQMFLFDAKSDALLKTIKHTGTNEELSAALTAS